ncbi:uncharacterized protein HKW66_Vig0146670 [Vigna angularis]|uniref:Uncharacterized protein n=1 Tax=Phaseolus angularis TaxID=3914 RepID=A0A8T0KB89_PHAAN|nr:uncharacterized protein HKW66_Vig0146670 [Vigna angularis]
MGYHRREALDHLRILASRFMPQNPTFRHSFRSCKSLYLDSGLKGAIFNGFSSWCSISHRQGAQGVVGVNGDDDVRLIGVEGGGLELDSDKHSSTLTKGEVGIKSK